jgi:hypothetical protein
MEGLDRIELVEQNNALQENQGSKTLHTEEKLTGRKVQCTGNTAKSEKVTTVSATQLSLLRPAIKSKKGGKRPIVLFSKEKNTEPSGREIECEFSLASVDLEAYKFRFPLHVTTEGWSTEKN